MRLLVDTHALLWFALDDPRLTEPARSLIEDLGNDVVISAATLWEIAIKVSIGKLPLHGSYPDFVAECLHVQGFSLLPIAPAHTTYLASMPFPTGHRDPFDRLLIAQALVEGIPIVGGDLAFDAYPIRRIW